MPKHIQFSGPIEIVPITTDNPETGEPEEGKQIVLMDPACGEIINYPMTKELADKVMRKLRMNNKALQAHLEEEAKRQQARQALAGGNGGELPPEQQKVVGDILKGVHHHN